MTDQHLAHVCPHCGRQDCPNTRWMKSNVVFEGGCRPMGSHARDREDYLTEECAAAEEEAARAWKVVSTQTDTLASARVWRRRARKWKRRARDLEWAHDSCGAVEESLRAQIGHTERERDEARAELDALRVRAQGMREALLDLVHGRATLADAYDAAWEPIP